MKFFSTIACALILINHISLKAQNVFNGEPIQVVGTFNAFTTTPYGSDYRTTSYRRVSVATGTPTDGRGQWSTTINVQTVGGDVTPINIAGGGGGAGGWLFITGPSANRFQNKWAFNGVGQAAINSGNDAVKEGTSDMGINMNTAGHYIFTLNDAGYVNTRFFVSRVNAVPISVTRSSQVINLNGTVTVNITSSSAPSNENIFVRYVNGADFSGTPATALVQASGSGMNYTATIPAPMASATIRYYVFTSTLSLAALNSASESDRSLAVLRYDDNTGNNYTAAITLPSILSNLSGSFGNGAITLNWKTSTEINAASFDIEKLHSSWSKVGNVAAVNSTNGSSYSFIDGNVQSSNVYRLKMIDKDGSFTYSNALTVDATISTNGIVVYPTLVQNDVINIKLGNAKNGKIQVAIINMDGKQTSQRTFDVTNGVSTVLQYPLGNLLAGNYVVKVVDANGVNSKSFAIVVK